MSATPAFRPSITVNWLWLTDLHFGQKNQQWLWPTYRENFFDDLARLHQQCGPWDAVVFTGDLVYSGKKEEFDELTPVLGRLLDHIGELQSSTPAFMSVPGNHDIRRPGKASAKVALGHWWEHEAERDAFWDNPDSEYRHIISEAHSAYSVWAATNNLARPDQFHEGMLPGDFSAVINKNGVQVGFVGLNTTFLQIASGDYTGKLDLHPRQLSEACGSDPAEWLAANQASILLTHQPPDWLHERARRFYNGAIYTPDRFAGHFFGHMHEASASVITLGMGVPRRQFQGCSLYGLEQFGEAFDRDRFKFGYASVQMTFESERGRLILWPRAAVKKQSGDWRLGPDQGYELEHGTDHTLPAEFTLKTGWNGGKSAGTPTRENESPLNRDCPDSRNARFILQFCPDGLPGEVLAGTLQIPAERLRSILGELIEEGSLQEYDKFKLAHESATSVILGNADELLGRSLEMLLGYIGNHKTDGRGAKFVDTAISLAKRCKDARPTIVCGLFDAVDRALKRRGEKHKVLETAILTIEAARAKYPFRTDDDVRREARALICGKSWVLQRIGRFTEAMADAEKSLDLGKKINWERNTAFCNKCIGRIYRIQAEQEADEGRKRDLLKKSVESLRNAVGVFKDMAEFGPDHPEVGDCYSLVARTYLVAGQLREARTYLTKAKDRLQDYTDKDYLDYLILEGDYLTAKGDHDDAQSHYNALIEPASSDDCEKSEIRARAIYRRGESMAAQKKIDGALRDFKDAARLWEELGERKAAAKSRWRGIVVGGMLSQQSISHLATACDTVKVIAFQLHEAKLAALQTKGPRRSEPDKKYWQYILREAGEQDAKQDREW